MKQFLEKLKILKNFPVEEGYRKVMLFAPRIARSAQPGQFVMLQVNDGYQPLLRRPLSIHSVRGERIELLYEVLGPGTRSLAEKKPGECLDAIGPLGKGFNYKPQNHKTARPQILIAGGMGVAPLLFLAERLAYSVERRAYRKSKRFNLSAKVLIGAKTKNHILCVDEFKKLGYEVKIATDDGSEGFKGRVTDLLDNLLPAIYYPLSAIYACGPLAMLKSIAKIAKLYRIKAQVSLEAHMSCGFGACLGCAVNTRIGYKRACKDGPVFEVNEIIWP